jgi:sialate O-acetylesterase
MAVRIRSIAALAAALQLAASIAQADIRLPRVLADNMVLQRNSPVQLWGWADPGERIRIRFRNQRLNAVADPSGNWSATLAALAAGGPDRLQLIGKHRLTLHNVLVGDVWLASGQSNMEFPLLRQGGFGGVLDAEHEDRAAHFPRIRLFRVKHATALDPKADLLADGWRSVTPSSVADFSAIAYLFGRELHRRYGVPIGLIESSWGGTAAESWMSLEGLQPFPEFADAVAREGRIDAGNMTRFPQAPTLIYDAMIAPLTAYRIRGVIWYQGESNADRAAQYRSLFPALIRDWRLHWGYEVPFLFVQLAGFGAESSEPADYAWADLRAAQSEALTLPQTAMAVAIDVGDAADIHPKDKQTVAHRLALAAERIAYGEPVLASGPRYRSMQIEGQRLRLQFDSVGAGLRFKDPNGVARGFAIAGADGRFSWAQARLDGTDVLVWNDAIPQPNAVRYDWGNTPDGNLYNQAGLPAAPFSTR